MAMDQTWRPISPFSFPPYDEDLEWQRDFGDTTPFVAAWRDFRPEFNIAGLWWRPLSVKLKQLGLDGRWDELNVHDK